MSKLNYQKILVDASLIFYVISHFIHHSFYGQSPLQVNEVHILEVIILQILVEGHLKTDHLHLTLNSDLGKFLKISRVCLEKKEIILVYLEH